MQEGLGVRLRIKTPGCFLSIWFLSGDFEEVAEAVIMETAHCGEARSESFGTALLPTTQ
ncbi:hypothetical protein [Granulicella sp. dw_53]|uniref:hypothetical protein n=1 Tax=Granulicella sp. dw_53 TaxID=2719792 RepID=UPI001BD3B052